MPNTNNSTLTNVSNNNIPPVKKTRKQKRAEYYQKNFARIQQHQKEQAERKAKQEQIEIAEREKKLLQEKMELEAKLLHRKKHFVDVKLPEFNSKDIGKRLHRDDLLYIKNRDLIIKSKDKLGSSLLQASKIIHLNIVFSNNYKQLQIFRNLKLIRIVKLIYNPFPCRGILNISKKKVSISKKIYNNLYRFITKLNKINKFKSNLESVSKFKLKINSRKELLKQIKSLKRTIKILNMWSRLKYKSKLKNKSYDLFLKLVNKHYQQYKNKLENINFINTKSKNTLQYMNQKVNINTYSELLNNQSKKDISNYFSKVLSLRKKTTKRKKKRVISTKNKKKNTKIKFNNKTHNMKINNRQVRKFVSSNIYYNSSYVFKKKNCTSNGILFGSLRYIKFIFKNKKKENIISLLNQNIKENNLINHVRLIYLCKEVNHYWNYIFKNIVLEKFINFIMKDGLKTKAELIIMKSFNLLKRRFRLSGNRIFNRALLNVLPLMETNSVRLGKQLKHLPKYIPFRRRFFISFNWIYNYCKPFSKNKDKFDKKPFFIKLAAEFLSSSRKRSRSFFKMIHLHELVYRNRSNLNLARKFVGRGYKRNKKIKIRKRFFWKPKII